MKFTKKKLQKSAKNILKYVSSALLAVSVFLFGKFSWRKPTWLTQFNTLSQSKPRQVWGSVLGVVIIAVIGLSLFCWYQSQPKPPQITAKITSPNITPLSKVFVPDVLNIQFGTVSTDAPLQPKPVAPLKNIGKEVTEGVTITPDIPGKWRWENDNHLVFTPASDWPAGTSYTIQFTKDFFASGVKMEKLHYSFSTHSFDAKINSFKFYQDPINPQIRQVVGTVDFNYPVDTNSLENKISLLQEAITHGEQNIAAKHYKYTISYNEHKRTAYIRSENLPLPPLETYIELSLAKGIKPLAGMTHTKETIHAKALIPDAESYFRVLTTNATILRNLEDQPEQVLTLETSLGVTQTELNKRLHVYLLPKDRPATTMGPVKLDYPWKDPGEVNDTILALAKPVSLQPIPSDRDYATLHSYQLKAQTPGYLYLKLDKGTQGFADFSLARDYVAILKIPEYPHEISFLHKGALLALGTDEKLSVSVRGLQAVKFNFARVLPNDINHLITQTSGDFSSPYFTNINFNQNNISEIFSQIQQFSSTEAGKAQYTALDFKQYLSAGKNNHPLGLFLLQAQAWDVKNNKPLDIETNRLILITDLGLIVKDNRDGTHDLFVQSISNGMPVKNASIVILGKNGLPLLNRTTDNQGHALFPNLNDFENEREPVVYLVKNGNDVSFIPYARTDRQLNYSRFDVGGASSNENQAALTAYLFTDRGIYRPGETTHIGMIVKKQYVLPQNPGLPLEAVIIDPRGVTVKDEKISLNENGFFTLNFQTNATAPTGQYLIQLFIVKDNLPSSLLGSTSIQVAEFLPDRLRIAAHLSKEEKQGWIKPEDLSVKVSLWNLYGKPAANHRIAGKILLTPKAIKFKDIPQYTFVDPLLNSKSPPKVFNDTLADTRTDKAGQATLDLKLDRFEKATYELTVFVEGFEADGGRSVTTQKTALVSPLSYFVGYKADQDLNYIALNKDANVHFIAIDPSLKQQALANLTIQLFSQHPVTTLVKNKDGTYQYQSLMQLIPITSNPFAIRAEGTDYYLPTNETGDFVVKLTDQNGTALSLFKYTVVGNSQKSLPKNAEIQVNLNKSQYAPGETIEMQITAPYTGAGLITLERDKVYAMQWFKSNTTASVQKITIPKDFQGNGYVNVAFVRDLNSPEIYISPLSYNVIPFSVTHQDHILPITLSVPTNAKPGESLTITYQTEKPGQIIIFAVDEGILQVTQYTPPDPLKFFFKKYALEVNTLQIVDQILPKFIAERELSAVGGDLGQAALYKNLNPFKRNKEAPVVYWSDILDSDTTPKQLVYPIPDYFNGSLQVMALAVAKDAVGNASQITKVRGDIIINPNVPTFVTPHDTFEITAGIANNMPSDTDIHIEIEVNPALEIIGEHTQTVKIPAGEERSVHFKLRAKPLLGNAEIRLIANANNKIAKMKSTLSVRPASPYFNNIVSGYSKEGSKTISLDRELYPEYRQIETVASLSPLILVTGLQNYLNGYPYGCTEQLVSGAFPLLVMAKQPWFANDNKALTDKIDHTIQMLAQRQMSSGGFNYWPEMGTTESNEFTSVYAMHFLTEAKSQGYRVPDDLYSAGIGFLKDVASQEVNNLDQARNQAYAIYILSRNEIVTTNYLTHLQLTLNKNPNWHWLKDITCVYIATSYELLKSADEANRLIDQCKPQYQKENKTTDFYDQNIANAQYLYLVSRHFPERWQKIDNQLVMSLVNAINSDKLNTLLSAYTSLALSAYGEYNLDASSTTLSISETLPNGKQTVVSSSNDLYQKAFIYGDARAITFYNPSNQGYFYQVTESGFDKELPTRVTKVGIEAYREYRDMNENPISYTSVGNEIIVDIRVRAIDDNEHDHIAIVDLLPGGFEVVRDSIHLHNIDYADVREDRVIFFASVGSDSKEIRYRIKATNSGKFTVPPLFATDMYHPLVKSLGLASSMLVESK